MWTRSGVKPSAGAEIRTGQGQQVKSRLSSNEVKESVINYDPQATNYDPQTSQYEPRTTKFQLQTNLYEKRNTFYAKQTQFAES